METIKMYIEAYGQGWQRSKAPTRFLSHRWKWWAVKL